MEFSRQMAGLVRVAGRGTVAVQTQKATVPGICWREDLALVAEHLTAGPDTVTVHLAEGEARPGVVLGRDAGTDLALVRVEGGGLLPLERGGPLETGHLVMAVAPHGVAMGIVSSISENWRTWRGGRVERLIRLDLNLAPGWSGAAVVDADGRLVGLATRGLTRLGAVVLPLETIDRVAQAIVTRGRVPRGYLGVGLQPVDLPAHPNGRGLMVVSLEPDAPAARAGLLLGDIVTGLAGHALTDVRDLLSLLDADSPGRRVTVELVRGGQAARQEVTVGEKE